MTTVSTPVTYVELVLTCASWHEARQIADHLLAHRLIGGAEFFPVAPGSARQVAAAAPDGIKLIMESVEHYAELVHQAVATLRSDRQFVLDLVPVAQLSATSQVWAEGIQNE
jgi:hypothetical protein